MTEKSTTLVLTLPTPHRTSLHVRAWLAVLSIALVASCIMNVLSLANSRFHARAYSVLEKFVSAPLATEIASGLFRRPLLANSPSSRQRQEIDAAVASIRTHNLELVAATRVLVDKTRYLVAEKKAQDLALAELAKNHAALSKLHEVQTAAAKTLVSKSLLRATRGVTRNFRTAFGKAIPGVGTVVTLAGTGYDVYDACNALREVNEFEASTGGSSHEVMSVCGFHLPGR